MMKAVLVVEVDEGKLAQFFNALAEVTSLLEEVGTVSFSTPEQIIMATSSEPADTGELEKLEKEIKNGNPEQAFLREQSRKLEKQRQKERDSRAAQLKSTDPRKDAEMEVGGLASLQKQIGKIPSRSKQK